MAKVLIGNFKGPKGDKGDTGEGKTGPAGAAGQRGSRWSEGTAITGTSTTATVFSGTGIADALANDMYMNTSTGNVYRCTVGGAAAVAKWVFAGNLKGTKGDKGNTGAKGATGLKALQPNRRWTSTFTTVGATASAPFTDFNRNPVVGDVFMNADGNSNIGQWKITAISGTTATFQLISYVSAKGAKGDTGASGTADTTFTEAATLTKLASGESFKAMLGKIAKAVSTIFDKFDKKNIVNNQTTTVAGFALDARQANPNIDGTLAKQLSDLNGSLNSKKIPSFGIENIFTGNPFCIVNNGSDVISVQTDWDIGNGGYRVKNIKYPAGTATNLTVSLSLPANSIVIVDVNTLNGENIDIQGSLIRCNLSNSASVWNLSIRFTGRTSQILSDIRYMPLVIHLG